MTEFNPTPEHGWTCFHCGEHFAPTFAGQRAAAVHFGPTPNHVAACIYYDAVQLRDLEAQLEAYRNEDTELQREIERLKSDHGAALRREEETGYARGVKDASNEPWLGNATCKQLLDELSARIEVHGPGLAYKTVDAESRYLKSTTQFLLKETQ